MRGGNRKIGDSRHTAGVGTRLPVRRHFSGRTIKILHAIDEFTRESLADLVDSSIEAGATVNVLDKLVGVRAGPPTFVRMDNGPDSPRRRCGTGAASPA
jgi:hypothetical protein